jgi:hypothetical protein
MHCDLGLPLSFQEGPTDPISSNVTWNIQKTTYSENKECGNRVMVLYFHTALLTEK